LIPKPVSVSRPPAPIGHWWEQDRALETEIAREMARDPLANHHIVRSSQCRPQIVKVLDMRSAIEQ